MAGLSALSILHI